MKEIEKKRHSAHQTQWAAQFAVASELCKRDYEVALTMGNHPIVDLMVISPKGKPFLIDVKGLYKRNFWPVREKKTKHERLFYVFAFVPGDINQANRFFVLSENEVKEGIRIDWDDAIARRKAKGKKGKPGDIKGVQWKFAERFENCWRALPK
jgi:hypothetical protein